ncbi:hypothetical protein AC578_8199 [Pseudocercospora eumusae]|uniref:Uncharacterized protein n=1 Tax=Pseudocercospora eumusae TaxID=321146 RepID=A0A139HET4_9PEZI|nr:hypothetical protein AC578_8199 [Pseudocercospora eumusae]
MAAAVDNPFDQLQSCPRDTRLKVFHQLWREGHIKQNGFTLYRYHVIPAILEEQRALHEGAMSLHYAEIRAGLRWSCTTEQQESFWRRQTQELLSGSIVPLQPETFKTFLQGRYRVFHEKSPELSCDAQKSGEGVDTSGIDTQASAQQAMRTLYSEDNPGIDDTSVSNRDTIAPADPDSCPSISPPDAPSSPKTVGEAFVHDHDSRSSAPDLEAPLTPSTHAEVSTPTSVQVAGTGLVIEEPASLSPMVFPAHKLRARKASKPPTSATSSLERTLQALNRLTPGTGSWQVSCTSLDAIIDKSGFTLFEYHIKALARRGCQAAVEADTEPGRFSKVWRSMLDHERDEWRGDTTRLKNGLQNQPQKELLNHFNITRVSNRLRRYQARVIGSLHAYLRDNSAAPFQLDRTSIVDVLLGTSPKGIETEVVIYAIRRSIVHRGLLEPGLHLWFRYQGTSFSYDGRSNDEDDGMTRLRNVVWRGLTPDDAAIDCQNPIVAMNAMLKPLVYLNRDNSAFADMENVEMDDAEIVGYIRHTRKSLQWAQDVIKRRYPLRPTHKELIVEAIMNTLRARRPKDDLSAESRPEEWSLESNTGGLAAKLLRCFDREGLDSRAYEDLMEQTMWAFFQVDPWLAARIDPSGKRHRERAVLPQYRGKCE